MKQGKVFLLLLLLQCAKYSISNHGLSFIFDFGPNLWWLVSSKIVTISMFAYFTPSLRSNFTERVVKVKFSINSSRRLLTTRDRMRWCNDVLALGNVHFWRIVECFIAPCAFQHSAKKQITIEMSSFRIESHNEWRSVHQLRKPRFLFLLLTLNCHSGTRSGFSVLITYSYNRNDYGCCYNYKMLSIF